MTNKHRPELPLKQSCSTCRFFEAKALNDITALCLNTELFQDDYQTFQPPTYEGRDFGCSLHIPKIPTLADDPSRIIAFLDHIASEPHKGVGAEDLIKACFVHVNPMVREAALGAGYQALPKDDFYVLARNLAVTDDNRLIRASARSLLPSGEKHD